MRKSNTGFHFHFFTFYMFTHQDSFFSSFIAFATAELKMESTRLKISAQKNPSTFIPSINLSAIMMMIALIAKRKSPSVKMVIGKVNKISNGFTKTFSNASTTANSRAVLKSAI